MLKIYGSDLSGPANKARFAANALGLKYEYIQVNLREGEQRKPEFQKLNPVGKIPVVDDDGFVLFESNAIIRYLADKNNSPLYPRELKARAVVDQWIDFISSHVGLAFSKVAFNRLFAPRMKMEVDERSLKEGLQWLDRYLPIVNDQLGKSKYIASDKMTIADIALLATLDPAEVCSIDLSTYKNIVQWRNALKGQEFYTKCFKEYGELLKK